MNQHAVQTPGFSSPKDTIRPGKFAHPAENTSSLVAATLGVFLSKARRSLPAGHLVPNHVWQVRHRAVLLLLWLHVPVLFTFGLLTVQYALFTAAITTYVVLLTDTLGEPALQADAQRALGTAIGIAIAFLAWRLYPGAGEKRGLR